MSRYCSHESVIFEYEEHEGDGEWVRATCSTCKEEGDWMPSKVGAIGLLRVGGFPALAWEKE